MAHAFRDTPIWIFLRLIWRASRLRYPEEKEGAVGRIQAALENWEHLSVNASISLKRKKTAQNANEKSCKSSNGDVLVLDGDDDVSTREPDYSAPHPLIIVDWYDEKDPANPVNWTGRKKSAVYIIVNFTSCVVYMASAIYTPSQPLIQEVFGVSVTVASLGLGLFIVRYGDGPLIWSPMSEMPAVGRNLPYLAPLFIFVILSIPTTLSNSIGLLLILRFLQGFFGSPVLATGCASLSDIVDAYKRPYSMYTWAVFSFAGPSIGNVIAGFTVPKLGWRWSLWEILITTSPALILQLFLPETSHNTILYYRAKRIRKLTGKNYYVAKSEIATASTTLLNQFYRTLVIPWKANLLDPSILFTSIYSGLMYAIFYSFFEFFPLVYGNIYGMNEGQIDLVPLCMVIAVTVSAPYFAYIHFVVNASARRGSPRTPEQRLVPAIVGSVLVPIGIFLFGWTSRKSIHWIVPTIGVSLTVGGFAVLLQTVYVYVGLAYPQYAASLFCGNGFVKEMIAFAGVLWSHPLYHAMGISKSMPLLGALCVLGILGILILFRWGDKLRGRSKFAS
ncbi:major facilitator superfamily domain-containing protein [Trichoderma evansii]